MKPSTKNLDWLILCYLLFVLGLSITLVNSNIKMNLITIKIFGIRLDYLLHVLLFVPWIILINWRWREKSRIELLMIMLVAGLLLAAISEGVQFILPYRSFNIFDLLSNFVGVGIGGVISLMCIKKKEASS